ncbi:putative type IX secretion system sortase PorU2 [Rhizosphaericola mali]|uniref:Gingipain domain-containing protein n=1 Tax=Rhizosphaericola mali TaxID=2545455 RepID=A0A5P2G3W9_9BACT|nr:C25 family cysteine peptidase [Rhizosphaericola mali]QES90185.1 hypothetical protein E0W69_016520 [Rhizosphaericola mali]
MKLFRYILRSAFLLLLFSIVGKSYAQTYNNEWIDYSKTYYKFKILNDGMYKITADLLSNLGLSSTPANQFQLWHNGKVVALYVQTDGSNPITGTNFIKFYGNRNDGTLDTALYKNKASQMSNYYSLETDSSAYFLTVNTDTTENLHFQTSTNTIPSGATPVPYYMTTWGSYQRSQINAGRASSYGQYVYSSTYDDGEGWVSYNINSNGTGSSFDLPDVTSLNWYTSGPTPVLTVALAGSSVLGTNRTVNLLINGTTINSQVVNGFNIGNLVTSITNLNTFTSSPKLVVQPNNSPASTDDRVVLSKIEMKYPRTFNFPGSNLMTFNLTASNQSQYIQITNFNFQSSNPELYDFTNGKRYIGVRINGSTSVWGFYVDASTLDRTFGIENVDAGIETSITNISSRTYTNPSTTQGNYLIISNSILRTGSDPVAQYQQYRNSSAGGSFNAQIYDISQLEDEFAWGIRMHPLAIKNFLKYARNKFSTKPEYCFLIGHGLTYDQFYYNQSSTGINQLAIIPTFGYPASDVLLASDNYLPAAATPIGRISAISTDEVSTYLSKIKEYEADQQSQSQTIDNKAWMKNIVHIAGGSDANESSQFVGYLNSYSSILTDTLMGGTVYNFNKYTNETSAALNDVQLRNLFTNGFSLMNYWGHASSTTLDYNLDHASNYSNAGKYPVMYINGCDVAGYYTYDASRLTTFSTIPEDFILTPNAGAIAFVAQSYLGVTTFLQNYSLPFYQSLGRTNYGKPISYSQIDAANETTVAPSYYPNNDTLATNAQAEGNLLLGDPYISVNSFSKPDFAIEDASVTVTPSYIDISQSKFHVKAYLYNLGRATGDSLLVQIKRTHPGGTTDILYSKNIASIKYKDSIELDVPISGASDKGTNSIVFTLDPNNRYDELSKLNNTLTKSVYIYEVGLTPIYPYKYSIVNKQNIKLIASTANPIAATTQYAMEIDTTALFNSNLKVRKTLTSFGGALEFDPGITFSDSLVYYWRVSPIPTSGDYHWNVSSFLYLAKATNAGFNQSHLYQQFDSEGDRISLDSASRVWNYDNIQAIVEMQNAILQKSGQQGSDFAVSLNGTMVSEYYCGGNSLAFVVLEPNTMKPYYNSSTPSTTAPSSYTTSFMGSYVPCVDKAYCIPQQTFEFETSTEDQRNKIRDFMDWIPNGAFVAVRNCYFPYWSDMPKAAEWKADGSNSMYSRLVQMGFSTIDDYNAVKAWSFSYKKNDATYTPVIQFSEGTDDKIQTSTIFNESDSLGYITSPNFGPSRKWYTMLWDGYSQETISGDKATVDIIGVTTAGAETTLRTINSSQKSVDISDIDAATYPYIKFYMRNADSINYTPYQLKYWRLLYDAVPEGALAANVYYKATSDSLTKGADYSMDIAFKNIGDVPFDDSLKVNYTLTDKSNVAHLFSLSKLKPLVSGDTTLVHVRVPGTDTTSNNLSTNIYTGSNTQYLDVNPDNNPIEQTHANNFLSQPLYVSGDDGDVSLDITFDGVHILNNDIVASAPKIIAKLTSESKYQLLTDTALLTLQLKYPDGTLKRIKYGTDTLLFTGAKDSSDNAALANFAPYLTQDGTYELIVQGKSTTSSTSVSQYSISFQVYNKPMISDMFNYPNPFTTSTAFVFTLTGSVVPQNIRIEILTITGKIVKEITKAELGPLKIGRNITEYKWDGTDQYGQKLANGVYIYRVITNLDGKKLDKFNVTDTNGNSVNTGQFFNKGYGKMYLMR